MSTNNNDETTAPAQDESKAHPLESSPEEESKRAPADPLQKDPEFYITAVHDQAPEDVKYPEPPQLPPENQLSKNFPHNQF